jgi:hypothetical protein
MPNGTSQENPQHGRIGIIRAVQTPLGFFVLVVLIVEAILGIVSGFTGGPDRTFIVRGMIILIFALVVIVSALAYFRPEALRGSREQTPNTKYSLLIGPPESMPQLDITLIEWDDDQCYLISNKLRENVALVPSRVGPSYRVQISENILKKISVDEAVFLELKDKKGNQWKVKRFYLFENLLPLSAVESREKIIQDYGEDEQ